MRLISFLLPLVVLMHTSAWQLDERRQMVEDSAFAVPQPPVLEKRIVTWEVEQPRSLGDTNPILDVLMALVGDLIPDLLSILTEEDRECQFIGQVNATILLNYRDLNVIIFHDASSNYEGLHDPICFDQDLPLPLGFGSKSYRICAFDTGTFIRNGDGGCRNWGFGACFRRTNDNTVSFCPRNVSPITATTSQIDTTTTTPQATTTTPFASTTGMNTHRPTTIDTTATQTTRTVSGSCLSGEIPCNTGCIPANGVCCPEGGYCEQGYICTSENTCQVASGSSGGSSSGSGGEGSSNCTSDGTCTGATGGGNPGGATTVTQQETSTVVQLSASTSSSRSTPTNAAGLSVPACLGVGVAAVMALMV